MVVLTTPAATRTVRIVPSVLAADLARLDREVTALEAAGADRVHWDVMDGTFVPNLTFGPDVIAAARPHASLPFEAHLMVADADRLLARYADAGCSTIIVHAEACPHVHRTLSALRGLGVVAGIALNPATPPVAISQVLDLVDLVLVMTVNPGFGGQAYLAAMEPKVAEVAALIERCGRPIELEVDGGIGPVTATRAVAAGARSLVAGTALFRHPAGLDAAVSELRNRAMEGLA